MRRRSILSALAAFVGFACGQSAHADVTTDDRLWVNTGIRTELIQKLDLDFTQDFRHSTQGEFNRQIIPAIGLSYGLHSHFSVGTGARYNFEKTEEEAIQSIRFFGDFEAKSPDMGPVELGYRIRFQSENSAAYEESKNRLRNRFMLQFDTKSMAKPELFYEHFLDPAGEENQKAKKYRVGGGVGLKLSQEHRLKFKFFQDKEIDGDGDKVRVIALGYRYNF